MIGYLIAGVILIFWFASFISPKINTLSVLILSLSVYYNEFTTVNIDLLIKILFLITCVYYLITKPIKKNVSKWLIGAAFLIFISSIYRLPFLSDYGITDALTAFASFLTGILLFCLKFTISEERKVLKTIAYLPIFSLIIGIPLSFLGLVSYFWRGGTALSAASMSTNLSFFGVISLMALIVLYYETHNSIYNKMKIVNFIIICATLTRGGILAAIIILLPDIINILKIALLKGKYILGIIFSLLLGSYPLYILWNKISERTFTQTGLDTSGRFTAWNIIISLNTNELTGMGQGSLKTLTNNPALKAFTAAHNTYIQFYYETGWIGLILLCFIFTFIIIVLMRYGKIPKMNSLFIMISFFTYAYTDNCIVNNRYWYLFMLVIGCILINRCKRIEDSTGGLA